MSLIDVLREIEALDAPSISAVLAACAARLAVVPAPPAAEPADAGQSIPAPDDRLLTVKEAAAILRKDPKWIYRHGDYPFIRKVGGSLLISKRGLDRWLERQKA